MPIGAIVNSGALALGGLAGAALGNRLSEGKKRLLESLMGLCALVIAIVNIVKLQNLTAVILSLILGTIAGESMGLDNLVRKAVHTLLKHGGAAGSPERGGDWTSRFCVLVTLFVVSGTGVFGILKEGFEGDPSILVAKAALDFFTALVFAASLGKAVSLIGVAQFCVYMTLFLLARWIYPVISQQQIMNFNAVGGLIDLAIGLTLLDVKKFRTINFLPAFIFVFPLTILFGLLFG
ncbi:MAG: DUF554 domain-containing protein [Oscillospiraceae bacterium]|jgi:uncharacterized membrane protein YqgA involved in biofilm formation|nr:DUF554 domain-containing protein [Oscillospiraceae bacterium]